LLASISAVQGAILDDDVVIKNLERIKSEAADLNKEVAKTEQILSEVKTISVLYETLAKSMSDVYFAMERLSSISFLYQFSLQFFLEVVDNVLNDKSAALPSASAAGSPVKGVPSETTSEYALTTKDAKLIKDRVAGLSTLFFKEISRRSLRGLHGQDKLMFMIRLAMIKMQESSSDGPQLRGLTDTELDVLVRGSENLFLGLESDSNANAKLNKFKGVVGTGSAGDADNHLSDYSAKQLYALSVLPAFSELFNAMSSNRKEWETFAFTDPEPENNVPTAGWLPGGTNPERAALLSVLVVRAMRPERALSALSRYVSAVFNESGAIAGDDWKANYDINLHKIVSVDSKCGRPVMICSERGQDASSKVDKLASDTNKHLLQVAMGSAEGFVEAEKNLSVALKQGSWVLLRNVHLCIDWLTNTLEKKVHNFATTAHPDFRLFLTCEIMDKLPTALLRASEVVIAESTTGVRANITRFYNRYLLVDEFVRTLCDFSLF
jgi:dynein heavy chain 1